MRDTNGFVQWLADQLEGKGWSHSELGRRSGLSGAVVSLVMNGKHHPGFEFCTGVAKALDEPPEKVLRLAGLLPAQELDEEQRELLLHCFDQMSPASREHFLLIARVFAGRGERVNGTRDR